MKTELVIRDSPELHDAIAVCGLPGAAFVGKFAVDHLIGELAAKPLAEIYTDGLPPQVLVKEDGSSTLLHNDLYYWKNSRGRDLVFLTADAQPSNTESEYELSERVIDYLSSECKISELVTLGAYVTGEFSQNPQVYAAGTDSRCVTVAEKMGCKLMSRGTITGMNGLLLGVAKLKGMHGYSFLGETSGYGFDGRAAEIVLRCISNLAGIEINFDQLEKRAKEAQEMLNAINRTSEETEQGSLPVERRKPNYIS
jgi:uncharacterized protein